MYRFVDEVFVGVEFAVIIIGRFRFRRLHVGCFAFSRVNCGRKVFGDRNKIEG